VVGNMVGSGVYLLPASLGRFGGISLVGWLFTAAGAMLLSMVFARLARLVPRSGGPYAYTQAGFGDFAGFLVGWGYWISIWAGNAAIAVGFASYIGYLVPSLTATPLAGAGTAVAAIWLLTWVNARGVRSAGLVQLATTILKIVPLIAVGLVGTLFFFHTAHFTPFNASGQSFWGAAAATGALTLWAFLGLESATVPAEHVRDPERTIPRATLLGTGVAALIYILATAGVMGVVPPSALATSQAPFADAARVMWGGWAGKAVAAGAVISAFGALNGWILLAGQLPAAVAVDGLFPERFARLSGRGTPVFGLVVSGILGTLLMATNYAGGLVAVFTFVILLSTLTSVFPYALCAMAELVLLLRDPERLRGRRLAATTAVAGLAFAYSLWAIFGAGRDIVFWGFLLLLAGIPIYVWLVWSRARRGAVAGRPLPSAE
jgi:APA family basic amino acid/polyamine antiporter